MKRYYTGLLITGLVALVLSCSSAKQLSKKLEHRLNESAFQRQFTGVLLIDAQSRDTLVSYNATKPFIPASNVKLLTLYTGLRMLPDTLPALKYQQKEDTLLVMGTGYPATLEPYFKDSTALKLLGSSRKVIFINTNLESAPYGPGWAWDDYRSAYMLQRSAMPIFGNVQMLYWENDVLEIVPPKLPLKTDGLADIPQPIAPLHSSFSIPLPTDTLFLPLLVNPEVERNRWQYAASQFLDQELAWVSPETTNASDQISISEGGYQILPGIPSDSLYGRMMQTSDNFLAEQIMLMASSTLGDSLSFEKARNHVLELWLADLPQQPRWVDGSGLSRYNLITPATLVFVLDRMYREIPRDRLFDLLASGKAEGTLDGMYLADGAPFVFAKTGTLSNNHNLSGFLLTRSGKTVVFSFMNNHYQEPTALIKERMSRFLRDVYEGY